MLEGAALGAYAYTEYRSSSLEATKLPATTVIVAGVQDSPELVEKAAAIADAVHTVRDLVNAPPLDLYPETLAARAKELATAQGLEVEILAEKELKAGGFGGILGVGQGSTRGPRLVKISYAPAGAAQHLALVGKGITFDSGGLSLKPPASMVGMKYDMTGAATVLAVVIAVARLAAADPGHRLAVPGGEPAVGLVHPAERRAADPRRQDGRGAQHGRRGPAGARRRPGRRERGAPGCDHRRRDPDRCRARSPSAPATPARWATTSSSRRSWMPPSAPARRCGRCPSRWRCARC